MTSTRNNNACAIRVSIREEFFGGQQIVADANYNIGVGAAGVDPTQHNREMSPLERTVRVVGGIVAAAGMSLGN